MHRIVYCFRGTNDVSVRIPAFLLLMNVLAETGLFLSRKLVFLLRRHLRGSNLLRGCPLRSVLLIAVNHRRPGNKLIGLLNATGDPGTLPVRSLILLHDVLERLLVEVAARFVLGGLVGGLGAARGMRNDEVLLIA